MASLGKYEILRKIAVGGMAEIYLACQSGPDGFEKRVVLKRLRPDLTGDEDLVRMFVDEARIAARLGHTNIVHIYDLGAADDNYFIAMEYVEGRNLAEIRQRGTELGEPIPCELVAHVISGVCRGLHYAHTLTDEQGRPLQIVHRDVSPENVLLGFEGEIKLADFGIAKATSRAAETQAGLLKGKFAYMSPEQCKGEPLDHRSDIFSIGILLYELVCHRRLFRRTSDFATMRAVIEDPIPPPSAVSDEVPDEIEAIVMRALARSPDDRYQDAEQIQIELEQLIRASSWDVTTDHITEYMSRLFPQREVEAYPGILPAGANDVTKLEATPKQDQRPVGDDTDEIALDETRRASPELVEQVRSQAQSEAAPLAAEPTSPALDSSRPDPSALEAALQPLEVAGSDPVQVEADDRTTIKPPDFDDIVEEDEELVEPVSDPGVQFEPEGPTTLYAKESIQQALASADTVLASLQQKQAQQEQPQEVVVPPMGPASAEAVTADLPYDPDEIATATPSADEAETVNLSHSQSAASPESETIDVSYDAQQISVKGPPPLPPAETPAAPPTAPAPQQELTPQVTAPSPPVTAAPAPSRSWIPLVIIAIALVLVAVGTVIYLLLGDKLRRPSEAAVSVTTDPPGATVYLNGKQWFGTTPLVLHGVPLDKPNTVVVMKERYQPWRKQFTLGEEETKKSLAIKLELKSGGHAILVVKVEQEGAKVFLNGEVKGAAPLTIKDVAIDSSHTLVIKKPGFENRTIQLEGLKAGEKREIMVGLDPAAVIEEKSSKKGRKGKKGRSGPVVIPRAKAPLVPLGGDNVGERVPGK